MPHPEYRGHLVAGDLLACTRNVHARALVADVTGRDRRHFSPVRCVLCTGVKRCEGISDKAHR